jgi:hypothetical protein
MGEGGLIPQILVVNQWRSAGGGVNGLLASAAKLT